LVEWGGGQDQLWRKKGEFLSEEKAQMVSVFAIYKGDEIGMKFYPVMWGLL